MYLTILASSKIIGIERMTPDCAQGARSAVIVVVKVQEEAVTTQKVIVKTAIKAIV